MRLEMAEFPVRQIRLGDATRYQDGLLDVDREDLTRLVLRDARIQSARFEIAAPGDPVRVTGIRDVVEPRVKFSPA
jgi:glycine reductase